MKKNTQEIFFTPGPTQLNPIVPEVLSAAINDNIGSLSHRTKKFEAIFSQTTESLRQLLNIPQTNRIFFLGSGTEAMERIIENCVKDGSFHFVNGEFSSRFYSIAQQLKKKPGKIDAEPGNGFDLDLASLPDEANLICFTQNETSTGVAQPEESLHKLKRQNPHKLFAVDIVSSAPVSELDYELIDCAFFSVQKAFGLPAGLGVLIVNEKCLATTNELSLCGANIGSFHNFLSLAQYASKNQTPETPNVLGIYLLGKVCQAYNQTGIRRIRKGVKENANLLYEYLDGHKNMRAFVKEKQFRSPTVITVEVEGKASAIKEHLAKQSLHVGSGYGPYKDSHIRIANFPMHSTDDIYRLIDALNAFKF